MSKKILLKKVGPYICYLREYWSHDFLLLLSHSVCLTVCLPMNFSMPGFPFLHYLPEFVHIQLIMPSNSLILCRPLLLLPSVFSASGSLPMSQFFTSGGQSTGVSASALVLPINIQYWFPSGLTGWISLQSKGLSGVFSNTTIKKHQFLGAQLSF